MFVKTQTKDATPSKARQGLLLALLLSFFFIHLPLMLFFLFASDNSLTKDKSSLINKDQVVMMDMRNLNKPKPIVDIAKPKVQRRPKKASAQALYDSTVKQETVASTPRKSNKPKGQPYTPPRTKQTKQPQKNKQKQKSANLSMQDQLKMIQNKQNESESKEYTKRFKSSPKKHPSLRSQVGAPNGGGGDYLPNYKIGNRTFLNTQANPNLGYYVRLKRKFGFAFSPMRVFKNRSLQVSRGKIAVIWGLTVDKTGRLSRLTLIRGSGMPTYDQEAKRTIRVSSPFSAPPSHLLDKNKELNMAWTFVVYL